MDGWLRTTNGMSNRNNHYGLMAIRSRGAGVLESSGENEFNGTLPQGPSRNSSTLLSHTKSQINAKTVEKQATFSDSTIKSTRKVPSRVDGRTTESAESVTTTPPRSTGRSTTPNYEPLGPFIPIEKQKLPKSKPKLIRTPSASSSNRSTIDKTLLMDMTTSPTFSPPPSIFQNLPSTMPPPRPTKPPTSIAKYAPVASTSKGIVKRSTSTERTRAGVTKKAKIDWSLCDPKARGSILFKFEYLFFGNPTYRQAAAGKGAKDFFRPPNLPLLKAPMEDISWRKKVDSSSLGTILVTEESFWAPCWVRDIIGDISEEDIIVNGPLGVTKKVKLRKERIRSTEVEGIPLYLIGEEFPCSKVIIMGVVQNLEIRMEQNQVIYSVDDSTGVIRCTCALVTDNRIKKTSLGYAAISRMEKAMESKKEVMRVGVLVKVTGALGPGIFQGSDLSIRVERIEAVSDLNLEMKHHLEVARMHGEVYNQKPLDLPKILDGIRVRERLEKKEAYGSQPPSSSGSTISSGSSPARMKPKRPTKLDDSALNIDTFITYIMFHLTKNLESREASIHVPSPPPRPAYPYEEDSDDDDEIYEPRIFSIEELEKDSVLRLFAELLTDPNDPRRTAAPLPEGALWQSKNHVQTKRGVNGGANLLAPPMKSQSKSKSQSQSQSQSQSPPRPTRNPMQQEVYRLAVKKSFSRAISKMLSSGKIVIAEPTPIPVVQETKKRFEEEALPDEPSRTSKKVKLGAAPWDQNETEDEYEEVVPEESKSRVSGAPWDLAINSSPSPSPTKSVSKSRSVTPCTPKKPKYGWSLADASSPGDDTTPKAIPRPLPIFTGFNSTAEASIVNDSTALIELDEVYELLVPATLYSHLLRIIKSEIARIKSRTAGHNTRSGRDRTYGVELAGIRSCLGNSSRFDRISNEVISRALKDLVDNGRIFLHGELYSIR